MLSFTRMMAALVALCFAITAQASGFDDGLAAFNNGNFKAAYDQWQQLADKGDARAQGMLGSLTLFGLGTARSDEQALKWFRKAADQNDPRGLNGVAALYSTGSGGLPLDRAEAVNWAQRAALQGYPNAEFSIGIALYSGNALPRNPELARLYLEKALGSFLPRARQNDIEAQFYVASLYRLNKVFDIAADLSEEQAAFWLQNAAEKGLPMAQHLLGYTYERGGSGLPKDEHLAAQWFEKAAQTGFPPAQLSLSLLYQDGRSVPKDDAKALELLRKAADQQVSGAQYQLGMRYAEGRGLERDKAQALLWLRRAADRNWPQAKTAIRKIEEGQTP